MTREEQIKEASIDFQMATNPRCIAGVALADFAQELNVNQSFIEGAKWADQHPKEGLWVSEKIINFLKERTTLENSSNINVYMNGATYHSVNDFIDDLTKAMEEQQ